MCEILAIVNTHQSLCPLLQEFWQRIRMHEVTARSVNTCTRCTSGGSDCESDVSKLAPSSRRALFGCIIDKYMSTLYRVIYVACNELTMQKSSPLLSSLLLCRVPGGLCVSLSLTVSSCAEHIDPLSPGCSSHAFFCIHTALNRVSCTRYRNGPTYLCDWSSNSWNGNYVDLV